MKRLLLVLTSLVLVVSLITSCKKSEFIQQSSSGTTMSSLKVSNTFNWSTGSVVKFMVNSAVSGNPVNAVLTVCETNGSKVYKCFHSSDKSLSVNLIIPRSSRKLMVKYGGNEYEVNLSGGTATFNIPSSFAVHTNGTNVNSDAVKADTDGDGVEDADDDYPTDPFKAFDYYYPASGNGTLAFEDLWPALGDFDFNDVVVDYRMQTVANAANNVVEVVGHYTLVASGATFHNGFGFQFDGLANNKISAVHGNRIAYYPEPGTHIDYTFDANGVESGQTYANIIVFDCFKRAMGYYKMINTQPDSAYISHVSFTDTVFFIREGVEPAGGVVASSELTPDLYNFYIVSEKVVDTVYTETDTLYTTVQDRGREIHLAQYHPTAKANPAYFMTYADSTTGSNYYTTSNGLPWGINIIEGFEYPVEKCPVGKKSENGIEAYHFFIPWAASEGTEHNDWYKRNAVVPGNRDDLKIYAKYHPGY